MGLAAAAAVASAGRDVVCLEQFRVGHRRGSSHGTSRIFRLAYPESEYTRLAQDALPLWRELEEESGESLLQTTGSLDVGGNLDSLRAALSQNGVEVRVLDGADLRRRFPGLRLPNDEALFHAEGGVLHADQAVRAFARRAHARGAEVREEHPVLGLAPDVDWVRIEAPGRAVVARAVVVAAGAWVARLVEGVPVKVTRETVAHFRLGQDRLPTVIDHAQPDVPALHTNQATYALASPGIGLKTGVHRSGVEADPEDGGGPDHSVLEAIVSWARERYELADPAPALVETCLYTSTEDERFLVERRGRVVVCSACSGHGFKFAPALGARVAALVEEVLAT